MAPPHPTAPTQQQQASSSLSVERSGRADAIAVWFDLWLDEERGEHDVVSTRPERCLPGDASGWVSFSFRSYWGMLLVLGRGGTCREGRTIVELGMYYAPQTAEVLLSPS